MITNRIKKRYWLGILVAVAVWGCAGNPSPATITYRTISAVKLAVDTGMMAWDDRVIDGKTTPQQEAQVRVAFKAYTAAAGVARAAMVATSDPAPVNLTAAADALTALLTQFGVVTGGK